MLPDLDLMLRLGTQILIWSLALSGAALIWLGWASQSPMPTIHGGVCLALTLALLIWTA